MAEGGDPPFTFGVDDLADATMGDAEQTPGCGHGQQGHGHIILGHTNSWSHSPIKVV